MPDKHANIDALGRRRRWGTALGSVRGAFMCAKREGCFHVGCVALACSCLVVGAGYAMVPSRTACVATRVQAFQIPSSGHYTKMFHKALALGEHSS